MLCDWCQKHRILRCLEMTICFSKRQIMSVPTIVSRQKSRIPSPHSFRTVIKHRFVAKLVILNIIIKTRSYRSMTPLHGIIRITRRPNLLIQIFTMIVTLLELETPNPNSLVDLDSVCYWNTSENNVTRYFVTSNIAATIELQWNTPNQTFRKFLLVSH